MKEGYSRPMISSRGQVVPLAKNKTHPLKVSFIVPAKNAAETLADAVSKIHHFCALQYADHFEIIIVVNPIGDDPTLPLDLPASKTLKVAENLSRQIKNIRIVKHLKPEGKYA